MTMIMLHKDGTTVTRGRKSFFSGFGLLWGDMPVCADIVLEVTSGLPL